MHHPLKQTARHLFGIIGASVALLSAPALAAPIDVTRFFATDAIAALSHASVNVGPAPVIDGNALENRPWIDAVALAMTAQGFAAASAATADFIVEVRIDRQNLHDPGHPGSTTVGLAGGNEGWHTGFGMGIGFRLGGGARDFVSNRLTVTIRDRASGRAIWEGRAENTEKSKDRLAQVDVAAPRIANAVLAGFPGKSGETIKVK